MSELSQDHLPSLNDSSFVILGQGSLSADFADISMLPNGPLYKPDAVRGSLCAMNGSNHCDTKTQVSWNSESDPKDIQGKLDQLLKENYQLKETLNQNNLAMKTQFDTLVMWQEEVFKTHQTHKEKFVETRELVLKLRAENAALRKQVESGAGVCEAVQTDVEKQLLKRKLEDLQQKLMIVEARSVVGPSRTETELQTRLEQAERNAKQLAASNETLLMHKNKLEDECKNLEQELVKTKADLEETRSLNEFLREKNTELRASLGRKESVTGVSLLPNSEARAQISNLFTQLEEERLKVSKLKEELHTSRGEAVEAASPASRMTEYGHQLDDLNLSIDKQKDRFSSMSSWLSYAEESVRAGTDQQLVGQLNAEIAMLRQALQQEQTGSEQKKCCLHNMQQQFQKLFKDYEELQKQCSKVSEDGTEREVKLKAEVESLTAQLRAKDELLTRRDKECEVLREHVTKARLECEDVGILRAQVDVYQSDFNAERDAREKLAHEKEELAERVRLLTRNVQMPAGDAGTGTLANTPVPSAPSASPETEQRGDNASSQEQDIGHLSYQCPKCQFRFDDLPECERHVDRCLDMDEMLP